MHETHQLVVGWEARRAGGEFLPYSTPRPSCYQWYSRCDWRHGDSMARTSAALVKELLQRDYDLRNNPPLTVHINSASMIVDRMVVCATNKGFTYTDDELEMIERWVAGYRYTHTNPVYNSKSTDGRSAGFLRQDSQNPYKKGAEELDPSGCLIALLALKRARIGMTWLGKRPSEAIDYPERD